jgi:LacI family gluconate utilization system Gnt-I transcriptional repressor
MTGRPTLKDVARLAGVSPITVSRTLRAPDSVAPQTRARVEQAVAACGYIPDLSAAQLASGASRMIAALVPTLAAPYFAAGLSALADSAERAGISVQIGQTDYRPERGDQLVQSMLAGRPRGLVLFGGDVVHASREALRRAEIPVVEAWELVADPIGVCIGFSHHDACRDLARALIASGRRRIAFAARGPVMGRAAQRIAGYRAALAEAGLPSFLATSDAPTAHGIGVGCAAQLDGMDAVLCAADTVALGVIGEVSRRGRRVPDDLAVAGFGDMDFSEAMHPSLTTVAVPTAAIGAAAAAHLLDPNWRAAAAANPVRDLGYTLIARASAPF